MCHMLCTGTVHAHVYVSRLLSCFPTYLILPFTGGVHNDRTDEYDTQVRWLYSQRQRTASVHLQ